MREQPVDQSEPRQVAPLPGNRSSSPSWLKGAYLHIIRDRKVRLAVIPLAVVIAAATVNLAVQALQDNNTSSPSDGAASVRPKPDSPKEQALQTEDQPSAKDDQKQPTTNKSVIDDGSGATTEVIVNGKKVTVPANGTYHETSDDGTTKTDVKVENRNQSSSSGNSSSNQSSSKIQINTQSNSTSESN